MLRLWDSASKICLLSINYSYCFNYVNTGQWFISMRYFEGSQKKNFFNFYVLDDSNKYQMSSIGAENEGRIFSFAITKCKVYIVTINDLQEIISYYTWSLATACKVDLKEYHGFRVINNLVQLIQGANDTEEYAVVIMGNNEVKAVNILNGEEIKATKKQLFEDTKDENILLQASISGRLVYIIKGEEIKLFEYKT